MSRPLAGYIGYDGEPTTDAAPGIWTLREAEFYKRKAQWPIAFAPSDITGLQLWLDASDASTLYDATTGGSLVAADASVARWEDKSGNDYHMTQATAGSRPARKTAIQGGLDVLRFDGTDDRMTLASSTSTFSFVHKDVATIFVAGKHGSTANPNSANSFIGNRAATNDNIGFQVDIDDRSSISFSDRLRVSVSAGGAVGSGIPVARNDEQDAVTANTYFMMSHVLDLTNGTAAERIASRINGGAAIKNNTDTDSPSASNATNDLQVGASGNNTGLLDGDICEILIYNSALSDTDREAVENYLLAKWSIT